MIYSYCRKKDVHALFILSSPPTYYVCVHQSKKITVEQKTRTSEPKYVRIYAPSSVFFDWHHSSTFWMTGSFSFEEKQTWINIVERWITNFFLFITPPKKLYYLLLTLFFEKRKKDNNRKEKKIWLKETNSIIFSL